MQNANTILEIIRERGKKGLPLERVYRLLFSQEFYLLAYGKIYRNQGAMTSGVTGETVDGMSLEKIQSIIEALKYERYRWTPARRVYIPKVNSEKKRPLGIPTWSDKLLQEVIRMILDAYYEPQFDSHSHGFRPKRGCHTALKEVHRTWRGTVWFIEGDIKGCFDNIDHEVLLSILGEKILDNRFLRLIGNMLKAGYLEDWKYNETFSGTPQGGIVSPILANIYLDKLDRYIKEELAPVNTCGKRRAFNQEYESLRRCLKTPKERAKVEELKELYQKLRTLPSIDTNDPEYRRMRYVRYADDFLIGFVGPKNEAEVIKEQLRTFLTKELRLEMSEAKTLITHARTGAARFLGYEVTVMQENTKITFNKRTVNGGIGLKVPREVVQTKCQRYLKNGKAIHLTERVNDSEFTIVTGFQQEYRGVVEYYRMAYNLNQFNRLKWGMERSLTKTLACKLKISVQKVYDRFHTTTQTEDGPRKVLQVSVEREGKEPLVTQWGAVSLKWGIKATLNDLCPRISYKNSELVKRLLADECELCGSQEDVEVHHIRALKDLQKKGRGERPDWVLLMANRKRKTLVACRECHLKRIHAGRYDGESLRK